MPGLVGPEIFFNNVYLDFLEAFNQSDGGKEYFFKIRDYVIRLILPSESFFSSLVYGLDHLRVKPDRNYHLSIGLWDSSHSDLSYPPMPWKKKPFNTKMDIPYFIQNGYHICLSHKRKVLNLLNERGNIGLLWMRNPEEMPYFDRVSCLGNILQWWFNIRDCYVLHSAAVGINGKGLLIAGTAGSGKSTTAIACVKAGMNYAGDDQVFVYRNINVYASCLYDTVKLDQKSLSIFPEFASGICNKDELENQKAVIFLRNFNRPRLASLMKIVGIMIPTIRGGSKNSIEQIPASECFRDIAPGIILQNIGYREQIFKFISRLVQDTPCYRFYISSDIYQIPSILKKIIEKL